MNNAESVQITDPSGLTFNAWLKSSDTDTGQVLLQLDDGTQFLIPRNLLRSEGEGLYALSIKLREFVQNREASEAGATDNKQSDTGFETITQQDADGSAVIRLAQETLNVGKRTVERARVRVTKRVTEREEIVDQPLMREEVTVEHVPINQVVTQVAPVRYEDDVTIIPLYEEVLVLEKKLMLVEEVRVTRHQTEHRDPQVVMLKREEVVVQRDDATLEHDETA